MGENAINTYTLTLDPNGGFIKQNYYDDNGQEQIRFVSAPKNITVELNKKVANIPDTSEIKRPGYTFVGWFRTFQGFYDTTI